MYYIVLIIIYFFIENIIYFATYKSYYMYVLISITSKIAACECP